jgi:hypothetical protein
MTTTGLEGIQAGMQASAFGHTHMHGIITAPSTGSPQLAIQCRAMQSGVTAYIRPQAFMKLIRIS